jgi:hypothetical protein
MTLGQPDTAAEYAAEQRMLESRAAAREARDARMVAEITVAVSRGATMKDACLRAARTYRLGKGGAGYARRLVEQAAR